MGLTFLHLTDIHHGTRASKTLYGGIHETFHLDLEQLETPLESELIFITGDIAFSGSPAEYQAFDNDVLAPLLRKLRERGSSPIVLAVPGNHDLARPAEDDDVAQALWSYHDQDHKRRVWSGSWDAWLKERFAGYTAWWDRNCPQVGPDVPLFEQGRLPGDFRATIVRGGLRIAVVGLNSAFLHVNDKYASEDGQSRLDINVEQLAAFARTTQEVINWLKEHDAAVLLTHHPREWLPTKARIDFEREVARWFDIHLCGHVHVPGFNASRLAGTDEKRIFKGASLFGLEYLSDGTTQRIHGYSAGKFAACEDGSVTLDLWPRLAFVRADGITRGISADTSFSLHAKHQCFTALRTPKSSRTGRPPSRPERASAPPSITASGEFHSASSMPPAPNATSADAATLTAAQLRSIEQMTRRVLLFHAWVGDLTDADSIDAAFFKTMDRMLIDMQRGCPGDRIDIDVLETVERGNDEFSFEFVGSPTSLDHQESLADMRLRVVNSAVELVDEPPGIAAWVIREASRAGDRDEKPGIAIANDVRASEGIEYWAPKVDESGYTKRRAEKVYKLKRGTSASPYRSLMTVPIVDTLEVTDDPSTPGIETRADVSRVMNMTCWAPNRFGSQHLGWARICASLWALLDEAYQTKVATLDEQSSDTEVSEPPRPSEPSWLKRGIRRAYDLLIGSSDSDPA